jgi:hypothetical protein
MATIPFTEKDVKEYLDKVITFWRKEHYINHVPHANYYIDAFQSVRVSLFGEKLPVEKNWRNYDH